MTSPPETSAAAQGAVQLVSLYRRALTWLGLGAGLAACTELVMLRHWQGPAQIVPWVVLGVLLLAAVAWLLRRSAATARAVQVAAAVAVLGSAYGVYEHVLANLRAGPLDPRYGEAWAAMSSPVQLWAAVNGSVGPSPVLVPGTMGLVGVLLWLAVFRWSPAEPRS